MTEEEEEEEEEEARKRGTVAAAAAVEGVRWWIQEEISSGRTERGVALKNSSLASSLLASVWP